MKPLLPVFAILAAFPVTCVGAPIDLEFPSFPIDSDTEVLLRLTSEQISVAYSTYAVFDVNLTGQEILVTVDFLPIDSEVILPAFRPLDVTVNFGTLPTGIYNVQAQIGSLGSGTSTLTIVPEPSSILLALSAVVSVGVFGKRMRGNRRENAATTG